MEAGSGKKSRTLDDTITVKVNGRAVAVPRKSPDPLGGEAVATTMLQACRAAGVEVPHYCYHHELPVAGNCRMCLVEFGKPAVGPGRQPVHNPDGSLVIAKSPRPAIACATPVSPGMEIYTETPAVKAIRRAVLEFLLINHPLDCPICDQAGECKLQEYSVDHGESRSEFIEKKVHKPKQVDLGPRIMLDDERCILCTRCIRFTRDIVGDDALGIVNRGGYNTLTAFPGRAFDNNYTLNTVDLCPVGALTSKDFRFRMRVWFLKETDSICSSCGTGCNIVVGSRAERIYRYTPRENESVNGCWMCDQGRLNYRWIGREDRLRELGGHKLTSRVWTTALEAVAGELKASRPGGVAIIASSRQTNEELYLTRKLAQSLGAITASVPRLGQGDDLLANADRNPNTTGARWLGIAAKPVGANLERLADAIDHGSLRTLIVLGEDVTKCGFSLETLAKLETFVVSDIFPNPTTEAAHYLLPGCAPLEKRGSFTNAQGRVQRFAKAVDPPGEARPEWRFLAELLHLVSGRRPPATIEGVFDAMAAEVPAFQGLAWAALGATGIQAFGQPEAPEVTTRT